MRKLVSVIGWCVVIAGLSIQFAHTVPDKSKLKQFRQDQKLLHYNAHMADKFKLKQVRCVY